MHPQIYEILKILEEMDIPVWMETNGLLLNEKMAAALAYSPNAFVSVSLDGSTAEVHDKIRGVSGAFDRSVQGIKNLLANGIDTQIIFSIMRENVHQYEEIIKVAEDLGVPSLKFNIVQPTERGLALHKSQRDVTIEEYIKIGRHIEEDLLDSAPIKLLYDHPIAFRPLHRITNRSTSGGVCGIKGILGVLADGTYALCGKGTSLEAMNFGKAGLDSLESIWKENAVINTIRYDLPKAFKGICADCMMKEICMGSCIAQNYYRTKDIHAPFWYCEEAAKRDLFPKSRLVRN
jgi:SynChlorMet cassette radical SAM/SPASM protein ScmF